MYRKQGRNVKYTSKYGEREETNTPNKRQLNKEDGRKETKKREKGCKYKQSNEGKRKRKGQKSKEISPRTQAVVRLKG
jgi:hypothetical protein